MKIGGNNIINKYPGVSIKISKNIYLNEFISKLVEISSLLVFLQISINLIIDKILVKCNVNNINLNTLIKKVRNISKNIDNNSIRPLICFLNVIISKYFLSKVKRKKHKDIIQINKRKIDFNNSYRYSKITLISPIIVPIIHDITNTIINLNNFPKNPISIDES